MDTIEKVYCTGHDNTEQRFSKIEESISRMESTVNNFINSFNHAQGNSNTAQ